MADENPAPARRITHTGRIIGTAHLHRIDRRIELAIACVFKAGDRQVWPEKPFFFDRLLLERQANDVLSSLGIEADIERRVGIEFVLGRIRNGLPGEPGRALTITDNREGLY